MLKQVNFASDFEPIIIITNEVTSNYEKNFTGQIKSSYWNTFRTRIDDTFNIINVSI